MYMDGPVYMLLVQLELNKVLQTLFFGGIYGVEYNYDQCSFSVQLFFLGLALLLSTMNCKHCLLGKFTCKSVMWIFDCNY